MTPYPFVGLAGCNLADANLTDANLNCAGLSNANWNFADLSGANWSNTICPDGQNSDNVGGTGVNDL